ncbi:LLM class F420-dependent oxidoreductase [Mycolicibacterium komossense]|uniref:LLM class F420-dependent oxidoreductase n=1 Tax=Mycolicibacterium komossense TaxID=1779 RepID=A0ABT3CJ65_9MYCO|nr:LLM class F420-dependent oxidoreductase [Mycolicibacterium komossense]MCV7229543.1 LLM class F420-dependent oxidoreductase [Mycolicibacterium komossense]
MRIGLSSPVVVQVPGVASEWERSASVEDLARIAQAADQFGFEFLTCSEHVAIPSAEADTRGAVYWDPLATLGFLAARTTRIRLATAVLVLGYHHPLEIAKQYGTLDRVSAGRLVLGVGIGSLVEEFELLGAPFDRRGARADDALRGLRAALSTESPAYDGPFYSFSDMTVVPHAVQPRVPIWVGGRSIQSLRRAVRLAEGWMPFGLGSAQIEQLLTEIEIPPGFEVVLGSGQPLDPQGNPGGARQRLLELNAAGATVISCTVAARSAEHYCAQLRLLKDMADTIN